MVLLSISRLGFWWVLMLIALTTVCHLSAIIPWNVAHRSQSSRFIARFDSSSSAKPRSRRNISPWRT